MITLKKAKMEDAAYILTIRNDLEIRQSSGGSTFIQDDEHYIWLKNFLTRKNHFYFIAELNNTPIGVVRFQPYNEINQSEISITIYPQTNQKKGYGKTVLRLGIEFIRKNTEINEIIARVLKTNPLSIEFFKNNHFSPFFEDDQFIFLKLCLE
ncbi:GNAT family N-acetyltransferase [Cytobacillus firmus]|uniref:GNAT family N-acetyltransferase n=1 Tax=Cytobacillus firmus TaxID=1399 RepID=UPI0018CD0EE0|nr:GNAT family N-acetyltransferase [Cytobacillus firmus]MBG9588629.1 hypothetical protein [Cytobacillus firmus]